MEAQAGNTIPAEGVRSIGEEIKNPFRDENSTEFEDIRFTVKDIKIRGYAAGRSVSKRKLCPV